MGRISKSDIDDGRVDDTYDESIDKIGKSGIERTFEKYLKGTDR